MVVKEAIIEFFRQKNVTHIFYLPGIHTLPLNQVLETSDISVFVDRHESNCAFMADGYARASGKLGVVAVTPGPGLGNVVSASMEAYGDCVPIMILHVDSDPKGWGKGVLHEIVDPESIFENFTKERFSVRRASDALPLLEKAYRSAITERCGPVVISIPHTLFEKQTSFGSSKSFSDETLDATDCQVSGLEEALQGKKRPVIIGGRALMRAGLSHRIEELCQEARIPFLTTTSAKGTVREDLSFAFGNVITHGLPRVILSQADVVIALGTRLRDADAKRRGVKLRSIIHIDVDDRWMGRNYPTELKVVCRDLSVAMDELIRIFRNRRSEWDIEKLKAAQAGEQKALLSSAGYAITSLLRSTIPPDTVTVWDLNLISYWAEYYFPVTKEGTFITPRGTSPIFYAVPAAIGAKIARPERPCLCVTGDGSSLPALSELATVKKYDIPVVFLIYSNNSYGILDDYMVKRYGLEGTMNLSNPDFVKLAQSFGLRAVKADNLNELGRVLKEDITWDQPFLVEFSFPVFPPPWESMIKQERRKMAKW